MATITEHEAKQIEAANASGKTPVVFIHGLWLLPSSWDNWAGVFEEAGYAALTPVWPDDPETVEQARANPDVFARKTLGQIADHTAEVIGELDEEAGGDGPLDRRAAGADDRRPRPLRGDGRDRSGPVPRRAAAADLGAEVGEPGAEEPAQPRPGGDPHPRPVQVRLGQRALRRGGEELYETYHVAAPGVALMQMANANLNPFTEAKVDPKNPDRGPLLIIDGEKDHTVPWAIANASYKKQSATRR